MCFTLPLWMAGASPSADQRAIPLVGERALISSVVMGPYKIVQRRLKLKLSTKYYCLTLSHWQR
jgi:hypothetical protein